MYSLPETVYLHKSIVGYKVMGFREAHRIAHHIGHMDDVIVTEPNSLWTELSNHGLPVSYSGVLFNPLKAELKMKWSRRGYVYHPDLLPISREINAVYTIEKGFLKLQWVTIISDNIELGKSTAPISIWSYFDFPLKPDEFEKLVKEAHGMCAIRDDKYIAQIKLNYNVVKREA